MAARIESAAHAEEFLQWVKFAPRGRRGLNTSGFDALYGGKTLPQLANDAPFPLTLCHIALLARYKSDVQSPGAHFAGFIGAGEFDDIADLGLPRNDTVGLG